MTRKTLRWQLDHGTNLRLFPEEPPNHNFRGDFRAVQVALFRALAPAQGGATMAVAVSHTNSSATTFLRSKELSA